MSDITKSEWVQWKNDRVTRAFLADLKEKRELLKEGFAEDEMGGDVNKMFLTQGRIMALKDTILYILEDFVHIER